MRAPNSGTPLATLPTTHHDGSLARHQTSGSTGGAWSGIGSAAVESSCSPSSSHSVSINTIQSSAPKARHGAATTRPAVGSRRTERCGPRCTARRERHRRLMLDVGRRYRLGDLDSRRGADRSDVVPGIPDPAPAHVNQVANIECNQLPNTQVSEAVAHNWQTHRSRTSHASTCSALTTHRSMTALPRDRRTARSVRAEGISSCRPTHPPDRPAGFDPRSIGERHPPR
jgi:hypothetical protein